MLNEYEEFISSMGKLGELLYSLPKQIWKNFWDLLFKVSPDFIDWAKVQGNNLEQQWKNKLEDEETIQTLKR